MKLAEWFFGLIAILGTLLWCAACIGAFAWSADQLVDDGVAARSFVMAAALAGLVFALWTIAKVAKIKRL